MRPHSKTHNRFPYQLLDRKHHHLNFDKIAHSKGNNCNTLVVYCLAVLSDLNIYITLMVKLNHSRSKGNINTTNSIIPNGGVIF